MQHPDDVPSPWEWVGVDADSIFTDLLSVIFAGSAWPEGSENAMRELADEWVDLASALTAASEQLQQSGGDLLTAWDAPAAEVFDDLARQLIGSPAVGLPGHQLNAMTMARHAGDFSSEIQLAKVTINIAVAIAFIGAVVSLVLAAAGGLSLTTLGPLATTARTSVTRALDTLAAAASRRAAVQEMGEATASRAVLMTGDRGGGLAASAARPAGVPRHYVSEASRTGDGTVWRAPGSTGDASTIRVMPPGASPRYEHGYARVHNRRGQPLGLDGRPGPRPAPHLPRRSDGTFDMPEGWTP